MVHDKLVITSGFIYSDPAMTDNVLAVPRQQGKVALLVLEQHGLYLRFVIFESEVKVAGKWLPHIGNLTGHRDKGELCFQQSLDGGIEL